MIIPTRQGLPCPDLGEWTPHLTKVLHDPKIVDLATFLNWRSEQPGTEIYPRQQDVFRALIATPPGAVKAVILGQDPYHGPGQAHGLAFSVSKGIPIPPSLENIRRELAADLGIDPPPHGDLSGWAEQGVLLLNTLLTVERGKPLAHKGKGWETFTDAVIRKASELAPPSVFMLWGSPARKKRELVDVSRHMVIEEVHPSPLSAHRGFLGSRPFSAANEFLESNFRTAIDWKRTD